MDFRTAIVIHLCLLVAHASCGVIPEALNQTAQLLRTTNLQPVLKSLEAVFGPFSNRSCQHLNSTELGEPEERPLTRVHLSYFSCYTFELSKRNQALNMHTELEVISQRLDSMEGLMLGSAPGNCSLPDLEDLDLLHYAGCLLQRLDHRLRNPTFAVDKQERH